MLEQLKKNWFKIAIITILIIIVIVFYQYRQQQPTEFDLDLKLPNLELILEKEKQENSEKQILFENKNKCFKYKEDILKKYSDEYKNKYEYDMIDIFYSPSLNTCFFVYWHYMHIDDSYDEIEAGHCTTRHVIKDLFNDRIIFYKCNAPEWTEKINNLKK